MSFQQEKKSLFTPVLKETLSHYLFIIIQLLQALLSLKNSIIFFIDYSLFIIFKEIKTFNFSDFIILDPSLLEVRVCDNKLSICFNNHRELCGVDIDGCACLSQELLMNCSNQAATVAISLVNKIKSAIQVDTENR